VREGKFRAVRFDNGKFDGMNFSQDYKSLEAFFAWNEQDEHVGVEIIIQEFTGIRDKNDVGIYEGDIIFDPSWWWGPCFVFFTSGRVGPCCGDNVMEWRLGKNIKIPDDGAIYNLWNGKEVEVVGSIFKNPELLQQRV